MPRLLKTTTLLLLLLFWQMALLQDDLEADARQLTAAIQEILELSSFVDANVEFCELRSEKYKEIVKSAADNWFIENNLSLPFDLINSFDGNSFLKIYQKNKADQKKLLFQKATGREDDWCSNLPNILSSDDWDIWQNYHAEFEAIADFTKKYTDLRRLPPGTALKSPKSPSYQELISMGINPKKQPIPDEFHCYRKKKGSDYRYPELIIQILTRGRYKSSFGDGRYGPDPENPDEAKLLWQSGVLSSASYSRIDFDDFGQSFELDGLEIDGFKFDFQCFQQGASDKRALIDFSLKDPEPGEYDCVDLETENHQKLELLPAYSYHLNGQHGEYKLDKVLDDSNYSSISWISGPLAHDKASYSENIGTGLRKLTMSSSSSHWVMGVGGSTSSLSVVCTSLGHAKKYQKFSNEAAPPPKPGSGGLSGFYYRLLYNSYHEEIRPLFYLFFPQGYVYRGAPDADPKDVDCTKTLPNGMPLCKSYSFADGKIMIEGTDKTIRLESLTEIEDRGRQVLNGVYWDNYFESMGTIGFGFSSSYYYEINYGFHPDGRFYRSSSSQSTNSFDGSFSGLQSTYAFGNSNNSNSGTYTIDNNLIKLKFNDGSSEEKFIMIFEDESFIYLDGSYMSKKSVE